ncbi:hypothetical protein X777_07508 [Ooceraea biroi]|uniref:Uncharacterized protein n=1 Tax=Ooceraea biroi TaxID=2015173 RepID=A0A026X3N9_OOCBI|nr:hypothetical protein X777_07508 [Ooceraea biroi]
MLLALDAILGHKSAHSFATGPVIADPFISPLLLTITPALSSKYINDPSFLRNGFRCRMTTAGITVKTNVKYHVENIFHLPVLSAQLITAPTGKPRDILNLAPADPPRPEMTRISW